MWIPSSFFNIFADTKEELLTLRAERNAFRDELSRANITCDWLRLQVNQLQQERAGLLEKAYGIQFSVPELLRTPKLGQPHGIFTQDLFEHIPDEVPQESPSYRPKLGD